MTNEIKQLVCWGFTKADLAKILGVTHTAVSKWYAGANKLSKKNEKNVLNLFNLATRRWNDSITGDNKEMSIFTRAKVISDYADNMINSWE